MSFGGEFPVQFSPNGDVALPGKIVGRGEWMPPMQFNARGDVTIPGFSNAKGDIVPYVLLGGPNGDPVLTYPSVDPVAAFAKASAAYAATPSSRFHETAAPSKPQAIEHLTKYIVSSLSDDGTKTMIKSMPAHELQELLGLTPDIDQALMRNIFDPRLAKLFMSLPKERLRGVLGFSDAEHVGDFLPALPKKLESHWNALTRVFTGLFGTRTPQGLKYIGQLDYSPVLEKRPGESRADYYLRLSKFYFDRSSYDLQLRSFGTINPNKHPVMLRARHDYEKVREEYSEEVLEKWKQIDKAVDLERMMLVYIWIRLDPLRLGVPNSGEWPPKIPDESRPAYMQRLSTLYRDLEEFRAERTTGNINLFKHPAYLVALSKYWDKRESLETYYDLEP